MIRGGVAPVLINKEIMKEIKLTQGYVALVDDEDYSKLSTKKWCVALRKGKPESALRMEQIGFKKQRTIRMHRVVLGITDPKAVIDHIDGNPLNNTKSNLRICTQAENAKNRAKMSRGSSVFKGVTLDNKTKKWAVSICCDYKSFYIGKFANELDAALAYNNAAKQLHGEFSRINNIGVGV